MAAEDPNHPNPYMFTGRRFDQEIGLYYYRARYYDPFTGRFLQTDPIGYGDGMNMYAYCRNNSLNFVDPSGRQAPITIGNPYPRGPNVTYVEEGGPQVLRGKGSYWILPRGMDPNTAKPVKELMDITELMVSIGSTVSDKPVDEVLAAVKKMGTAAGKVTSTRWRVFIEVQDWNDLNHDGKIDRTKEMTKPYWIEVIELCSGAGDRTDNTAWASGYYESWGDAADAAGTAMGWAQRAWEGKPAGFIPELAQIPKGYTYNEGADPYVREKDKQYRR